MLVEGYEVGEMPTPQEFRTCRKVEAFEQREAVAQYVGWYCKDKDRKPTQEEFERICDKFAKLQMWLGEDYDNDLWGAFNDVMWGREVY